MSLKCLIVEDSQFMQEIYHHSLVNAADIEVVGYASDGNEAIRLLSEKKPDLLILDLILPLMNGIDVLKQVSQLSPQTKTIVISSLEDEETIAKTKALGAIDYLKKPFTKVQLVNAIEEVSKYYAEVNNG